MDQRVAVDLRGGRQQEARLLGQRDPQGVVRAQAPHLERLDRAAPGSPPGSPATRSAARRRCAPRGRCGREMSCSISWKPSIALQVLGVRPGARDEVVERPRPRGPPSRKRSARCEPRKPAAPVMRTRTLSTPVAGVTVRRPMLWYSKPARGHVRRDPRGSGRRRSAASRHGRAHAVEVRAAVRVPLGVDHQRVGSVERRVVGRRVARSGLRSGGAPPPSPRDRARRRGRPARGAPRW